MNCYNPESRSIEVPKSHQPLDWGNEFRSISTVGSRKGGRITNIWSFGTSPLLSSVVWEYGGQLEWEAPNIEAPESWIWLMTWLVPCGRGLCGETCHPNLAPFRPRSVLCLVTHSIHGMGPRHPKWRQCVVVPPGVCDFEGFQVPINEKCRSLKFWKNVAHQYRTPSRPLSTVGWSRRRKVGTSKDFHSREIERLGNWMSQSVKFLNWQRVVHINVWLSHNHWFPLKPLVGGGAIHSRGDEVSTIRFLLVEILKTSTKCISRGIGS